MSFMQQRNLFPVELRGLPRRFEKPHPRELPQVLRAVVLDYLTRFWDTAPEGIAPLFLGRARTWKSYAAAVICGGAVHAQVPTDFVSCPSELLNLDLDRFSAESRSLVRRWEQIPFLVLDDFAVIREHSFPGQILTAIAAARFDARLPTVWTGNLGSQKGAEFSDIARLYSPMLARRLEDGSKGFGVVTD